MDANTPHTQESAAIPQFSPENHQPPMLSLMDEQTALDPEVWNNVKPMAAPLVWAWYDQHKDQKVAKIGGFYQVTVGSFHIAEMVISAVFGPRPA